MRSVTRAGYLLVWLGFGVAAHLLGAALHQMEQRWIGLTFNAWVLGDDEVPVSVAAKGSPRK